MKQKITWDDIKKAMPTFRPTTGGFSIAKRGIVTLADGATVFVKLAVNEETEGFINEEIRSYEWLAGKEYMHVPELLLSRPGGIVLSDLSHFDWSDTWSEKKLKRVLESLDELSRVQITAADRAVLKDVSVGNGWSELIEDAGKKEKLVSQLQAYPKLIEALQVRLHKYADICDAYQNERDQFVPIHADVRSDNLAYDEVNDRVYLADWNWMGLGNKGLEDVGLLVNVAHSGFNVEAFCPERLDEREALLLTGFWLSRAMNKIWEGGDPALRALQFKSGLQAAKWAGLI